MSDINWDLAPEGAVEIRLGRFDAICRWFNANNEAFGSDGWFTPIIEYKTIATRPQTKTVADEGEKWTHTWKGDKCRIVFTEGESSWINGHFLNTIVHNSSLKPIKPKLTKAEAWERLASTDILSNLGDEFVKLSREYEII